MLGFFVFVFCFFCFVLFLVFCMALVKQLADDS